jgi:hypothetical protein
MEPLKVGDRIMAPYKKFTWLDRILWRLFRYQLKRKSVMREYVVTGTNTGDLPPHS